MRKLVVGFILGCALSVSATAFAAPVKEFILNKISYPILVNGVEYNDEKLPALNYEGNTYIPLAKIGDLLGVNYRWNADLKRVEIGDVSELKFYSEYNGDIPSYAKIIGIPEGKRVELSDGKTILYKYDVTDVSDGDLEKYVNELEKQGYLFEDDTSDDEISYFSKGNIVVGLTIMEYDFNVIITTD